MGDKGGVEANSGGVCLSWKQGARGEGRAGPRMSLRLSPLLSTLTCHGKGLNKGVGRPGAPVREGRTSSKFRLEGRLGTACDDIKNNRHAAKTELPACQAQGWQAGRTVPIVSGSCSKVSLPVRFADPTPGKRAGEQAQPAPWAAAFSPEPSRAPLCSNDGG